MNTINIKNLSTWVFLAGIIGIFLLPSGNALAKSCSFTKTDGSLYCSDFGEEADDIIQRACAQLCTAQSCDSGSIKVLPGECPTEEIKVPTIKLANPLGNVTSPASILGRVVRAVVGVVGAITFLVFIYGGFLWLTSAGKEDQVTKGTHTMIWAVVGLLVIFSSYIVLKTIIESVAK